MFFLRSTIRKQFLQIFSLELCHELEVYPKRGIEWPLSASHSVTHIIEGSGQPFNLGAGLYTGNQYRIKAAGYGLRGVGAQVVGPGSAKSALLGRDDGFCSGSQSASVAHLYEYEGVVIVHDQIDLAKSAMIVALYQNQALLLQMGTGDGFSPVPATLGRRFAHSRALTAGSSQATVLWGVSGEVPAQAAQDRHGEFFLIGRVRQTFLFLGIGDITGLDQNR